MIIVGVGVGVGIVITCVTIDVTSIIIIMIMVFQTAHRIIARRLVDCIVPASLHDAIIITTMV